MVWVGSAGGDHLAPCLVKLFEQVNKTFPNRDRSSDGTIGDSAHAATKSEHNPDGNGVVRAMDITHDPRGGFNSYTFAESLRNHKDTRILYVISNGRIFSSQVSPWVWRAYNGSNRHDHHVHVSVVSSPSEYNSVAPWKFEIGSSVPPGPETPPAARLPVIRKGSKGDAVKKLQTALGGLAADGDFGPLTEAKVRAYQAANQLAVDGIVGPYTWEKLGVKP